MWSGTLKVRRDYIRVQRPGADDTVHVPGEAFPADVAAALRTASNDAYDHASRCWTLQLSATKHSQERSRPDGG